MRNLPRVLGPSFVLYALLACGTLGSFVSAAELIVTDQAGARVLAFDAATGAYTRTLVSGLGQPSAISWGPDDSVYVTDLIAGTVIKINPETGVIDPEFDVSGIDKPGSIHFDESNNTLLVGEFGDFQTFQFGDEIFTYNANGTLDASRTINAGATGHSGLATDAQGNLYVSGFVTDQFLSGHVLKYGPQPMTGARSFQDVFASSPLLQGAAGMAFDAEGNLFVAGLLSGGDGALIKFTVTGGVVTGEEEFDGDIAFPSGMTLLPDGSLVVTALGSPTSSATLYKYDTETGDRVNLIAPKFTGDFNDNLVVDGDDLSDWEMAFGDDDTADADADGDSDGNDFLAWQRGLGVPVGFSPSGVVYYDPAGNEFAGIVPEPSAAALALIAALAAACWSIRTRAA